MLFHVFCKNCKLTDTSETGKNVDSKFPFVLFSYESEKKNILVS